MKSIKWTSVTVFVLFFGLALIEAVQKGNWLTAGIFLALGILSLLADLKKL